MLAERADEVVGQRFTLIDVSADGAYPALLLLCLRCRLDVLMIEGIGSRRSVGEHKCVFNIGDKEQVRAQVDNLRHISAQHRIHALGDIDYTILGARESDALSTLAPLWNPQCLKVSNEDFSERMETLNLRVRSIIPQV